MIYILYFLNDLHITHTMYDKAQFMTFVLNVY